MKPSEDDGSGGEDGGGEDSDKADFEHVATGMDAVFTSSPEGSNGDLLGYARFFGGDAHGNGPRTEHTDAEPETY